MIEFSIPPIRCEGHMFSSSVDVQFIDIKHLEGTIEFLQEKLSLLEERSQHHMEIAIQDGYYD